MTPLPETEENVGEGGVQGGEDSEFSVWWLILGRLPDSQMQVSQSTVEHKALGLSREVSDRERTFGR